MKFTGERFVPSEEGEIRIEHLNRYYFVINQVNLSNLVILDIASGEGYGSDLLARHANHVYGVDISSEAIEHSKKKYSRSNLEFVEGNATSIPLNSSTIDVVVSFETIEHHNEHTTMIKEIKRVLKPNGILFISSPDKLYYSDNRNYQNEFHVKELYSHEFKALLNREFMNTKFYSQKIFVGSMIALDEYANEYNKPVIVNKEGVASEFAPLYNIGIATDDLNFNPTFQLVLYNESSRYAAWEDIEKAVQEVRKSFSYRLGKLLLRPLKSLKNL